MCTSWPSVHPAAWVFRESLSSLRCNAHDKGPKSGAETLDEGPKSGTEVLDYGNTQVRCTRPDIVRCCRRAS